jgi:hypothetical protein
MRIPPLPGEDLQLGVGSETGMGYLKVGEAVKDALMDRA